jgi:hypothetical protein
MVSRECRARRRLYTGPARWPPRPPSGLTRQRPLSGAPPDVYQAGRFVSGDPLHAVGVLVSSERVSAVTISGAVRRCLLLAVLGLRASVGNAVREADGTLTPSTSSSRTRPVRVLSPLIQARRAAYVEFGSIGLSGPATRASLPSRRCPPCRRPSPWREPWVPAPWTCRSSHSAR